MKRDRVRRRRVEVTDAGAERDDVGVVTDELHQLAHEARRLTAAAAGAGVGSHFLDSARSRRWRTACGGRSVTSAPLAVLAETTEKVIQDKIAGAPSFRLGIACRCKAAITGLWVARP